MRFKQFIGPFTGYQYLVANSPEEQVLVYDPDFYGETIYQLGVEYPKANFINLETVIEINGRDFVITPAEILEFKSGLEITTLKVVYSNYPYIIINILYE